MQSEYHFPRPSGPRRSSETNKSNSASRGLPQPHFALFESSNINHCDTQKPWRKKTTISTIPPIRCRRLTRRVMLSQSPKRRTMRRKKRWKSKTTRFVHGVKEAKIDIDKHKLTIGFRTILILSPRHHLMLPRQKCEWHSAILL